MRRSPFRERLRSIKEKLTYTPADTIWITQPENRRYLSGFKAGDTQCNESSGSLLINKRTALLITDSRYTIEAQKDAPDLPVVTLKKGIGEGLPDLLKRMGTRVLGFEEDHLIHAMQRDLQRRFRSLSPQVRLIPLKGLVEGMREIKGPEEIRAIQAAADLMSHVLGKVIASLVPGREEREVAWQIETLAREEGAEGMAFSPIVASGPNGALPHAVPTRRKLRAREPIILDVGLKMNGYCCDMSRTVFLGSPVPRFKEIYRTVRNAQLSAMKEISPGVESTYPDSVARGIIKDAGYGGFFGHALGHGVGLATHEGPRLGPLKSTPLKQGMVVTVEPGIYIPGKGGVRLEQMVVIGEKGPRILTRDGLFYEF